VNGDECGDEGDSRTVSEHDSNPLHPSDAAESEALARLALGVGQHGGSVSHVLRSTYEVKANTPDMIKFQRALSDGTPVCVLSSFEPLPDRARQLVSSFRDGTRRLLYEPNAGGASEKSEAVSYEVLQVRHGDWELVGLGWVGWLIN
jgi:hypothetical protein